MKITFERSRKKKERPQERKTFRFKGFKKDTRSTKKRHFSKFNWSAGRCNIVSSKCGLLKLCARQFSSLDRKMSGERYNIHSQLEHLQSKYIGTGHADTTKFDWLTNQVSYTKHSWPTSDSLGQVGLFLNIFREKSKEALIKMRASYSKPSSLQYTGLISLF